MGTEVGTATVEPIEVGSRLGVVIVGGVVLTGGAFGVVLAGGAGVLTGGAFGVVAGGAFGVVAGGPFGVVLTGAPDVDDGGAFGVVLTGCEASVDGAPGATEVAGPGLPGVTPDWTAIVDGRTDAAVADGVPLPVADDVVVPPADACVLAGWGSSETAECAAGPAPDVVGPSTRPTLDTVKTEGEEGDDAGEAMTIEPSAGSECAPDEPVGANAT